MTNIRRRFLAVHEAGHAVAATILGGDIEYVTIDDGDPHTGWPRHHQYDMCVYENCVNSENEAEIVVHLAGAFADARYNHKSYERAFKWACSDLLKIEFEYSHDEWWPGSRTGCKPGLEKLTRRLLRENWVAVLAVADALMERGTLWGDEVRALVGGGNWLNPADRMIAMEQFV